MPWTCPRLVRVVPVAVALVAIGGCRSASPATGTSATPVIPVILHDFTVDIGQPSTTSRDVVIRLTNHGPTTHELNVVRTDHPANALPLRADGLTVDDASPAIHHVAEAEGLDIGDHRTLRLHLTPGRYVFYCNMEGHYPGRMFTSFEVQA